MTYYKNYFKVCPYDCMIKPTDELKNTFKSSLSPLHLKTLFPQIPKHVL